MFEINWMYCDHNFMELGCLFNWWFDLQLHGVDDNIGKSRKILTAMSKRMDKNKWIIGSIIVALVLAILLVLYFKLAH